MRVGVFYFPVHYGIEPGELARELEARGFESLFVCEHTHIPVSRRTPFPGGGELPKRYVHTHDPFVALAFAAAATKKLLLGTGICLVPQHDPIVTAKTIASLDRLSGGRFLFGIGAGWNADEMENHGVRYANSLRGDARTRAGDEGAVDRGRGVVPRRVRELRSGLELAEAAAAAAPADPARRRDRPHLEARRFLLRRLVPTHRPGRFRPDRRGRQAAPHGGIRRPRPREPLDQHFRRAPRTRRS